jgi:hypothetical protein
MEKGFKPQPNCQRRVDCGVLDPNPSSVRLQARLQCWKQYPHFSRMREGQIELSPVPLTGEVISKIHYSLLITHYSLLITHYSLLIEMW